MLFETKAGPVRLHWNDRGLSAIEMPELPPRELRAALAGQNGIAAPDFVREAAGALKQHLDGEPQDLSRLPLDLTLLGDFQRAVYQAVRALPAGRTATYGEIAALLGEPGGFSAPGGVITKQRLLSLEGVKLAVAHGLPFDPEEASRVLSASDRKLARLIERVGPFRMRPEAVQSPFEALAESIVYQQLTGKAASTILGRVVDLFRPRRFPRPQDLLEAPDALLRKAGLSRNKTAALKDLAAKAIDGTVPPLAKLKQLSDTGIIERLTAVRGVGPWTVEMLLIFRLARPDVLPATDYGVRKGFAKLRGLRELPTPKELLEYGERWRPFRSVASWYLWRALDL